MKTCNFCFYFMVSLQVSEPYRSTALTSYFCRPPYGRSITNACLAFPIRAWMSLPVPPFLLTIFPSYASSSTSSIPSPCNQHTITTFGSKRISSVFAALIFRPTFAPCFSKTGVLSLMPSILYDNRARSSAKLRSSKDAVKDHWIPLLLARAVLVTQSTVTRRWKAALSDPCFHAQRCRFGFLSIMYYLHGKNPHREL